MRILVMAEIGDGTLRPGSLSCLSAARSLAEATGGEVAWLVAGSAVGDVAKEAAEYAPVLVADAPPLANSLAGPVAQTVTHVVREHRFDVVTAACSTFSKDAIARAAGQLGCCMASDIVRLEWTGEGLIVDCPQFAGAVTATVRLKGEPLVLSVRSSAFSEAERLADVAPIETVSLDTVTFDQRVRFENLQSKSNSRPDVTEARVVVSGGRALRNSEDFERLIGGLADALGGAAGSSRALVDAGIAPNELQVGQTGKVVAPDLYIAAGISGAVQHLAGMKNSRTVVAINSDPEAPIFEIADYGLVADVYEALPELIQKLSDHGDDSRG